MVTKIHGYQHYCNLFVIRAVIHATPQHVIRNWSKWANLRNGLSGYLWKLLSRTLPLNVCWHCVAGNHCQDLQKQKLCIEKEESIWTKCTIMNVSTWMDHMQNDEHHVNPSRFAVKACWPQKKTKKKRIYIRLTERFQGYVRFQQPDLCDHVLYLGQI